MSENPFDKPDDINWAYDPDTLADTAGAVPSEPDANRMLNGWSNTIPDEPSPSHVNFLHREALRFERWLEGRHSRHFTRLDEGIAAITTLGRLFWVDLDDVPTRLASATHIGDSGNSILALCTDGERLYVVETGGQIRAFAFDAPDTASELWSVDPSTIGDAPRGIAADGSAVYVYYAEDDVATAVTNNTYRLNRDTGATTHAAFTSIQDGESEDITSNGSSLVFLRGTTWRDLIILDADDLGTTSNPGVISNAWDGASGELRGVAIAADRVVAWGTATGTGGYQIRCYRLSDGAVLWSYAFASTTEDVNHIVTDGERVYAATDARTDSVAMNVICLNLYDGTVIWRQDCGGDDAQGIATDGRRVFVVASDGAAAFDAWLLDSRTGLILGSELAVTSSFLGKLAVADGIRWILATSDDIISLADDIPARQFQRAAPTDPNRRPFHHLAIPV